MYDIHRIFYHSLIFFTIPLILSDDDTSFLLLKNKILLFVYYFHGCVCWCDKFSNANAEYRNRRSKGAFAFLHLELLSYWGKLLGATRNMNTSWFLASDRKKNSKLVTVGIETYGSLGPRGHIRTTTDITWCITVTSSGDEMTLAVAHKKSNVIVLLLPKNAWGSLPQIQRFPLRTSEGKKEFEELQKLVFKEILL